MRRAGWVLLFAALVPAPGPAQQVCLRPLAPEAFEPPMADPEFRSFLSREYETYILQMQDYLNCLGAEHTDASREINEVLARWLLYFGEDAVIHVRPAAE